MTPLGAVATAAPSCGQTGDLFCKSELRALTTIEPVYLTGRDAEPFSTQPPAGRTWLTRPYISRMLRTTASTFDRKTRPLSNRRDRVIFSISASSLSSAAAVALGWLPPAGLLRAVGGPRLLPKYPVPSCNAWRSRVHFAGRGTCQSPPPHAMYIYILSILAII